MKISNRNRNKLMRISKGFLCVLIFFPILECSSVPTKRDSNWIGYTESGKASYYAKKFQSKKTASGELYDKAKMTAAHKKLPFGTIVKVTNKKNKKSVIVKINDRGPFVKGRIVDLSNSAFSCVFRSKVTTHSVLLLPPIPLHCDHPFRNIVTTCSA